MEIVLVFFVAAVFLLFFTLATGLMGWFGPMWSQRMGNLVVVLSLVALLIKIDLAPDNVLIPYFDEVSCVLGIVGAFWGAIGEVVCRGFRSPNGVWAEIRKAMRE